MRRICLLSIVLVSVCGAAGAERRPRFGGVLRVETLALTLDAFPTLEAYKVAKSEAGKSATLIANDAYAGGRVYLDGMEITLGRSLRDQALDFELGRADVIEVSPAEVRRLRARGANVVVTKSRETLALICEQPQEALALSIDREAIHSVILQRAGEATGALIPQWLSGYAFLFAPVRDVSRAKQTPPKSLRFAYDHDDPLIRAIAERIVVNAAEAGITLRVGDSPEVRLQRLPLAADLTLTLNGQKLGMDTYDAERAILADFRVIPLFHLPLAYQVSPRVKNWLDFDRVWLTQ